MSPLAIALGLSSHQRTAVLLWHAARVRTPHPNISGVSAQILASRGLLTPLDKYPLGRPASQRRYGITPMGDAVAGVLDEAAA
jgi:hypothetical protein